MDVNYEERIALTRHEQLRKLAKNNIPDHNAIYRNNATKYQELISKQPPLDEVVQAIRSFDGLDIVDLGAGTGRLSAVLAPKARSIVALDGSEAMLHIAAARLKQAGRANWRTVEADHRSLPLAENSADLVVAGWSLCYLASANVEGWEQNVRVMISEIKRVLRPGGTAILFETLGTGCETPVPPEFLKAYYAQLVELYGFSHRWLRMDYRFDTITQAEELTRFFFGEELADRVARERLTVLPECAGIWWLHT